MHAGMRIPVASYPFGATEAEPGRLERGRRGRSHRAAGPPVLGGGEGPAAGERPQESKRGRPGERSEGVRLSPELDEATRKVVREMAARDREVRAHEAAHAAVGGHLAGAPSLTFETGPDGKRYAVAGEVSISMPQGGSPEARIRAARQVRAAALAPAQPSGADQSVAASAAKVEMEARAELAQARREARSGEGEGPRGPRRADGAQERAAARGLDDGERPARAERRRGARAMEPAEPRADIRRAYHQHADGGSSCPHCRAGSAGELLSP